MGSGAGAGQNLEDSGVESGMLGMFGAGITANPVGFAGAAIGTALSAIGGVKQYQAAQSQFGVQQKIFGLEQQAESQRKQMMELNARRSSMETVRNAQRARSLALSNSTSQGAQFGSGLQGGYGQISGQSGTGLLGISQQRQAGENLFDINAQITQQRQQYSALGSQQATGGAISQLGGTVGGLSRSFGKDMIYSGG